jgi:SagB-type dehydrogenase family enzyme
MMKISRMQFIAIVLTGLLVLPALSAAQEFKAIDLPAPQKQSGKPLMQALNDRHSTRNFSSQKLPAQMLSNLLWAAFGINRPDSGKRTAPSAMNWQEVDIYVAAMDGVYIYNAAEHRLDPVLEKDIRADTGTQGFVDEAPINLIYVADYAKMGGAAEARKKFYAAADTGFISQNVYLYCASAGLATVVRGSVPREQLAKTLDLRAEQHIILAQTVGFPGD